MTGILKGLKLFGELSKEELKKLSTICEEKNFRKGEVIFSKNDPANELYILIQGECEVKIAVGGETEHYTIYRLKSGQIFGEIGFIEQSKKRTATIKCSKDSKTLILKRKDFDKLVIKNPRIGLVILKNLSKMLAERLRLTDEQLGNFYLDTHVSFGRLFG